jgi:hypothetical protein
MDKDGDLDCYLLNNSFRPIGQFDLRKNERNNRDPLGGNKLYRNDNGKFVDVSEEAGIYGSIIGFGLGVTVGDVNRDGWQDIYVSNDFFERDYLYINNHDGTFTESLEEHMREISAASMGADMADLNNDGYPEVFVTDMLPEGDERMKTKTTFEDWNKYQSNVKNGYYHQFTRNVLQLNNGPTTPDGDITFSEIGRLSGVHATDWSWGALIMDLDNNGYKDIFVANGIYQDLTDQDFIHYIADPRTVRTIISKDGVDFKQLIDAIPSNPIPNYIFANNGSLDLENKAQEWGLGTPSHSNGTAYGDLDNDGDLDMVINNVNMPPFVYRNNAETLLPDHHYLQFILKGENPNTYALGAQIEVRHGGREYFVEQMPVRGFQSTMDHRPLIGLGNLTQVDSVIVRWVNDHYTILTDVQTNQTIELKQADAQPLDLIPRQTPKSNPIFTEVAGSLGAEYIHKENQFKDFDRDRLIYHMLSSEGPKIAKGDVNRDGREDFYIGGAKDSPGQLFVQLPNGKFRPASQNVFAADKVSEDTDCLFFDADNDGDQDLYVASGGNEFPNTSSALADRLYINDGRGNFTRSRRPFSGIRFESTSCVQAADYDGDGDLDLFVGIRLRPFLYGVPASGYILNNDGKGTFTNVTETVAPSLLDIGLITDALWMDVNQDGNPDLVVAGEWMPIKVFLNQDGKFTDVTEASGLSATNGFWNCLKAGDFDQDGDLDLVVGNHGLNTRFKASQEYPVTMHTNDFDGNGTAEQIVSAFDGEDIYPLALRHDLVTQMPILKRKYLKYESYKNQKVEDIFTPEQLERAVKMEIYMTETSLLINEGGGKFSVKPLPVEVQFSPIYGISVGDFDRDGLADILLGGNFHRAKPEVGIYDANYGLLLKGKGKGEFEILDPYKSGFFIVGEVRDIVPIKSNNKDYVLVAKNDDKLQIFEY